MTSIHSPRALLSLLAGAFLLANCAGRPPVPLESVAFEVAERANNNAPVATDLVFVATDELADEILKLTAAEWFRERAQILRDHPDEVEVVSFELVPGQVVPMRPLERRGDQVAAIVFAKYETPGAHRVRFTDQTEAVVVLGSDDVEIRP